MELFILDDHFNCIAINDSYKSLIWVDRYTDCGDFELQIPANIKSIALFKLGQYVEIINSDRTMIIEQIEVSTDEENMRILTITGRSIECLLERRIIWGENYLNGNLQDSIETILNENAITPMIPERIIPGLHFIKSDDERIKDLLIEDELKGENLLEAIRTQCSEYNIGFKMIRNGTDLNCSLYIGTDHSYQQNENSYVVFSPKYDNLDESKYLVSDTEYKNAALVIGEKLNDEDEKKISVAIGEASGIDRREISIQLETTGTDNVDLPNNTGHNYELDVEQYKNLIRSIGKRKLIEEHSIYELFDCTANPNSQYRYGHDYFIGDIVQMENDFEQGGFAIVGEMIINDDENGMKQYPTFMYIGG